MIRSLVDENSIFKNMIPSMLGTLCIFYIYPCAQVVNGHWCCRSSPTLLVPSNLKKYNHYNQKPFLRNFAKSSQTSQQHTLGQVLRLA